jgi:hypothetical protein
MTSGSGEPGRSTNMRFCGTLFEPFPFLRAWLFEHELRRQCGQNPKNLTTPIKPFLRCQKSSQQPAPSPSCRCSCISTVIIFIPTYSFPFRTPQRRNSAKAVRQARVADFPRVGLRRARFLLIVCAGHRVRASAACPEVLRSVAPSDGFSFPRLYFLSRTHRACALDQ